MSDEITLARCVVLDALAHAHASLPAEACGLISGHAGVGKRFHPARNALASPFRFDIDGNDLVRIMLAIEDSGEELVATFHSHPTTDAIPSATDVREARYPVAHLIASMRGGVGSLRAWSIRDSGLRELDVRSLDVDQQSVATLSSTSLVTGSSTMSIAHEPSSSPER